MSISFEHAVGFVLDQERHGINAYRRSTAEKNVLSEPCPSFRNADIIGLFRLHSSIDLQYHHHLFDIHVPFMMDSEFAKFKKSKFGNNDEIRAFPSSDFITDDLPEMKQSRKRKRKVQESSADVSIRKTLEILVQESKDPLVISSEKTPMDNNGGARDLAKRLESLNFILEQRKYFENDSSFPVVRKHGEHYYVIPSRSTYICSPLKHIDYLLNREAKFDFLVMDPPWNNKSAKRLKTYDYLDEKDFLTIPVSSLTHEGSLVGVWLTTNERIGSFVEAVLFRAWNLTKEAEWTWVKVTTSGDPIQSFSSGHKKPYEKILFGRVGKCGLDIVVPDGKVIVSVPSAIHSQKPCLDQVMKRYLTESPKCLELFARSLIPGWTSWGLEVLKLQNLLLFEPVSQSLGS